MTDLAPIVSEVRQLLDLCARQRLRIAVTESCTGGLIAAAITEVPGSSVVFDRGYVTYSDAAKTDMLGVPADLIKRVGAVSEEVAVAMAEGGLARSGADLAVAVTGIAGPDGGTAVTPVGLVHFAAARRDRRTLHAAHAFADLGRDSIRFSAVREALRMLMQQAAK